MKQGHDQTAKYVLQHRHLECAIDKGSLHAAFTSASDACLIFVYRRIGSDEEQQLLKSAKDDLNIASSKRQGMTSPALMQHCLQTDKVAHPGPGRNFTHSSAKRPHLVGSALQKVTLVKVGCCAGDDVADSESAIEMLDNLQQHPQQNPQEATGSLSANRVYVYPLVLIAGCVSVFVWRKLTLSRLSWNRRRFSPSTHEV